MTHDSSIESSPIRLYERDAISPGTLLAFLLPSCSFVYVQLIGFLFLPEIIMLAVFAYWLFTSGLYMPRIAMRALLLGILWFIAQAATDAIRETPFVDWSRGISKIIVFLSLFLFMQRFLNKNNARLLAFAVGTALGGALQYLLNPRGYALGWNADGYWKFGLGTPVTLAVICALCVPRLRRRLFLTLVILLALCLVNLLLGYRSMGGFVFATGMFVWFENQFQGIGKGRSQTLVLRTLALSVVGIVIFVALYDFTIKNAWTEYSLTDKIEAQSGDFGSFVGGRIEMFASVRAIVDSPVIGHGSWAKDPKYRDYLTELRRFGYSVVLDDADNDLIPSHSYFFGAWVEAGMMGALFWGWCLVVAIRALYVLHRTAHPLAPLLFFLLASFVWAILFSPFGAEGRMSAAFNLTLAIAVLETAKLTYQSKI